MNLTLLPGRLLLVKDPPETHSPGGILYPDVERVYASSGWVMLHEPGGLLDEDLSNRRIIFSKWSVKDFEYNGTLLTVLRESNVLAVVEEENADERKTVEGGSEQVD